MTSDSGYGQQDPNSSSDQFNAIAFLVRQMIGRLSTMKPVKVLKVTADAPSALGPAGTVDVLPLVMQVDGGGNTQPHGTVYGLPYFRLAAGSCAIIMDPKVDDVGFVVCADRDISAFKQNKEQSPPGSARMFDLADGVYVGSILAAEPERYVLLSDDSIKLADGSTTVEVKADGVYVTGNLIVDGGVQLSGAFTAVGGGTYQGALQTTGDVVGGVGTGNQISLRTHRHGGVTTGGGQTAVPVPGS